MVVILINVVVEANQILTEVALFQLEEFYKAPTRAVGEDSLITLFRKFEFEL